MTSRLTETGQLARSLTLRDFFAMGFGTIIGVGWIVALGIWLSEAGPLGATFAFLIGTLAVLPIAICYAEMATMYPVTGGPVAYAFVSFGKFAAFLTGWTLVVSFIGTAIFEAISIVWILEAIFPGVRGAALYEVFGGKVYAGELALGLFFVLVLWLINHRGAAANASFQLILTSILLIASIVFVCCGVAYGSLSNLEPLFVADGSGRIWSGIISVAITVPFFLAGFEAVSQGLGERVKGASLSGIGWVIVLSVCAAGLFYISVILGAAMISPREDILGASLPAAEAFSKGLGSVWFGNAVLCVGLLGLVTTWNASVFVSARVLFALSRAGLISKLFGYTHFCYKSPSAAVSFVSIATAMGVFLGRDALLPLINASALSLGLVFLLVCASLLSLRSKDPDRERPFRVPYAKFVAGIGVLSSIAIVVFSFWEPYLQSDGKIPLEWYLLGVSVVAAIVVWVLPVNRSQMDEAYLYE